MSQKVSIAFYYFCILASFFATLWCILEYKKDYDITEISYQNFDSKLPGNQYPSMSLCFLNPYRRDFLSHFNDEEINITSYSKFIKGDLWNDDMLSIDYNSATIDLRDYIISSCITPGGQETMVDTRCLTIDDIEPLTLVSPMGVYKCFTLSYNIGVNLNEVLLAVNNSIFPDGWRPTQNHFMVVFHYPNQIIRSVTTALSDWPPLKDRKKYHTYHVMKLYLTNIEILKRRRDGRQPCYDWETYDNQTIEDVVQSVGCRPPYWTSKTNYELCKSSQQIRKAGIQHWAKMFQMDTYQPYVPPCIEVQKIDIMFTEVSGEEVKNEFNQEFYEKFEKEAGTKQGWFAINIYFWKSTVFKEIKQVKAYSVQSVIGNAGGYIGLLVGVTISDLPDFLLKTYRIMKQNIKWI